MVLILPLAAFELRANSSQCVVGTAKDWNSSHVTLNAYEKRGGKWVKSSGPWTGRLGKNGLVWGLGISPLPAGASLPIIIEFAAASAGDHTARLEVRATDATQAPAIATMHGVAI